MKNNISVAIAVVVGASIIAVPQILWVSVVIVGLCAAVWLSIFTCKLTYGLLLSTRRRRVLTLGFASLVAFVLTGLYMQDAQRKRNVESINQQGRQCEAGDFDSNWSGQWRQTYSDPDFAKLSLQDQQSVYWGIRKDYCDRLNMRDVKLGHADFFVKFGGVSN